MSWVSLYIEKLLSLSVGITYKANFLSRIEHHIKSIESLVLFSLHFKRLIWCLVSELNVKLLLFFEHATKERANTSHRRNTCKVKPQIWSYCCINPSVGVNLNLVFR